jgi:hypothetical protein
MVLTEVLSNARAWSQYLSSRHELPSDLLVTPNISFPNLETLAADLESKGVLQDPHAGLILDWDGTCRMQRLSNIWKLRFGEINDTEATLVRELHAQLCKLLIVTNQIDSRHWLADLLGFLKKYDAYPTMLQQNQIPYVGAPNLIPGITPPFKHTEAAVTETIHALTQIQPLSEYHDLYVIGDQVSDMIFAQRLHQALQQHPEFNAQLHPYLLIPESKVEASSNPQPQHQAYQPVPVQA